MPAVQALKDDCVTAADVWKRAYEVQKLRARMRGPVTARFQEQPKPCAQPVVLDFVRSPVRLPSFSFAFEATARFAALIQEPADQATTIPKIKDIQRLVAMRWGVTIDDMKSDRRSKDVVEPRQIAVALCRHLTPLSLPQIGRQFGGRDHTTILHTLHKLRTLFTEISDAIEAAPLHYLVDVAFRGCKAARK